MLCVPCGLWLSVSGQVSNPHPPSGLSDISRTKPWTEMQPRHGVESPDHSHIKDEAQWPTSHCSRLLALSRCAPSALQCRGGATRSYLPGTGSKKYFFGLPCNVSLKIPLPVWEKNVCMLTPMQPFTPIFPTHNVVFVCVSCDSECRRRVSSDPPPDKQTLRVGKQHSSLPPLSCVVFSYLFIYFSGKIVWCLKINE